MKDMKQISIKRFIEVNKQIENITSNQTRIAMSNLVPASYFVKVIYNNKEVKTFKIIKK